MLHVHYTFGHKVLFYIFETLLKVKKKYGFICARHAKKNLLQDFGKFSLQTLVFVTNIIADNSIMCLWFQTEDWQQKHATA